MASRRLTCLLQPSIIGIFAVLLSLMVVSRSQMLGEDEEIDSLKPTVLVAVLVRNKAHSLPWFFGHLDLLDYPKERMALWIRSDHNLDNSSAMVKEWLAVNQDLYNSVDFTSDDGATAFRDETGPYDWSEDRFEHVCNLREQALQSARAIWADYLLMIDADVILTNPNTLNLLIEQKKTIVAPMLNATIGDTYSNYWGGVGEDGFYERVPEYFEIVHRKTVGCFPVPVVHTVFLINMRHAITSQLSFLQPEGYSLALDDIVIFSQSAIKAGLSMHILNTEYFGRIMIPLDSWNQFGLEAEQFVYARIEQLDEDNPNMEPGIDYEVDKGYQKSPHIYVPPVPKDKLGFDHVYFINLKRRPERRTRMVYVLDQLGIEADAVDAVDGRAINDTFLRKNGITMLPGYADPYHKRNLNDTYLEELEIKSLPGYADPYDGRVMKIGEIGCYLSHYNIWKDVLDKKYQEVVVFEDDLRFEPYFRNRLKNVMNDVGRLVPDWDLIYLGRKILNHKGESYVKGSKTLVWPSYSYWTLSYLLSYQGAEKLINQQPLQKIVPVDEYLPIMFDRHPEGGWKEQFYPRNLVALSAEPLLIYPTHYLGEQHYISDTEDSKLIEDEDEGQRTGPTGPRGPDRPVVEQENVPGQVSNSEHENFIKDEL